MRAILLVSGGLIGAVIALILLGVVWPGLGHGGPGLKVEDFGQYWSSARVRLEGGNPYDPIAVWQYQQAIEPGRSGPALPWGPPWSMGLLYPFAAAGFPWARWAWLLFGSGMLLASAGGWCGAATAALQIEFLLRG